MQKITPCLWFDDKAEEAVNFYASVFNKSKIKDVTRYGEAGAKVAGRPKGTVMTVTFELEGQEFMALNGGPVFKFSPAISLMVHCETQEELDELWEKLSSGGEKGQCGWLTDKYGVSWQIVPGCFGRDAAGQGCRKVGKSHGRIASNEQARHRDFKASVSTAVNRYLLSEG